MRSWDSSTPADGGHSGGPDRGTPAMAPVGAGLLGLRTVRGLGARLVSVGRRRRSRLPRPSTPAASGFGEFAGAVGRCRCNFWRRRLAFWLRGIRSPGGGH